MNLLYFDELPSTNAWLLERWRELDHLTAVSCGTQSAGRGRLGRTWLSDCAGNLYLSLLFKPVAPPFPCVNMTQYASVVLCRVLADCGVKARIKWPNDVLVDGRKIAGLLSSLAVAANAPAALVLGLGVNLNAPADFLDRVAQLGRPATSLHRHTGGPVDREAFLEQVLSAFMSGYADFARGGFPVVAEAYKALFDFVDHEVTVDNFGNRLTGTVKTITHQGELLLEDAHGVRHVITVGELT